MPNVPVPYAAFLRVYEPLAAFPESERSHWAEYARRRDLPGVQEELNRSLAALPASPARLVPERESRDAYVAVVDGVVCVCPWQTRLRSWEALGELEAGTLAEEALEVVAPARARRRERERHTRWRRREPDARPWIRSALWHVPLRWFPLFVAEDRLYREPTGDRPADLRYRTPMDRARSRAGRAMGILRAAVPDGALAPVVEDVGRWLEEFHPRSLVELDYGGLVHTISRDELAGDRSAEDIHRALGALAVGRPDRAAELYEAVAGGWTRLRERRFAS